MNKIFTRNYSAVIVFVLLVTQQVKALPGNRLAGFGIAPAGLVTNINTGETFSTIQSAINDAQTLDYHVLEVQAGNYDEQIVVNKRLTIKGIGASQPVINFTGVPAGKKTVIDISRQDVTIDNLNIKVDLVKLSSGIIVSGTAVNNLTISNNKIEAYGSSPASSSGSYSDRNAVSINYSGATNYRIASGGVNNIVFTGNSVTGTVNDGFGIPRYFRSAVSADDASGNFSNNTLQSINHDILARFGNNGAINISNNTFNGGGVEFSDMNAGAGALIVTGNQFNASFANTAAANTAVLRLKNNYNSRNTNITNNTFTNHEWAVSLENYNAVILSGNSFTPLAGSTGYHHITVNTKTINTNSATIVQKPVNAVIRTNTFNGSGVPGGTAVMFLNHDADAAVLGPVVLGGPGFENDFNAGIQTFIALDHQTGASGTAFFPLYPSVIGTAANAVTTMTPWTAEIFAVNNRYDVGSGLELPEAMSISNLFALEDKVQHKIDAATLGFVVMNPGNDYVTTNSFLSPVNAFASVQRAVDAASTGYTVNVGPGVFTDNIIIDKTITLSGQGQSSTKIIPAVSNPDCGGSTASICAGGSNVILVRANNVGISYLTIDGNNPALNSGIVAGGEDIDARNGIITDHTAGVFNNLSVSDVTVKNIFLRGIYASSGGSFSFMNNIVDNVQGNSSSIGIFNYGGAGAFINNTVSNANDAIASNWSKGSIYVANRVSQSGSGIHTDNNGGQGGTPDIIQGNQVSNSKANGYGIWVFAPYLPIQVRDNTILNVEVGLASAGQQSAVTPVFAGNTVDGLGRANSTGVYITSSLFGFGSTNVSVLFINNFVRNNTDGFYLESETGTNLVLEAHNNSFSGNSNSQVTQAPGGGSFAVNMECNWWGTNVSSAIAAGLVNAPAVDYTPRLTNGTDLAPVPGFQPQPTCANPLSDVQVTATTNIECYGAATGTATISFANGVAGFNYSLDGGTPVNFGGSPFTISNIAAGTHTVVITDGTGNTISTSFAISQPVVPLSAVYSATPISCYGGLSTESITIQGGTAPYTVTNQGGGALVIGAAEGVTYHGSTYAATYVYTVTDAKGCQYTFTATITQPAPLAVTASATDISCNNNSIITVSANGGTAPYSGTGSFTVPAGTYTYSVTDANGCTASATVTPVAVTDIMAPTITAPAGVSVSTDAGYCSASGVALGTPVTGDNCGVASVANNAPTVFPVGTTTVTWTVTDNNGNTSTATQLVTVTDTQKPYIKAPGNYSVVNATGQCGKAISNLGTPTTSDNCGIASVSNDAPAFFPVGTTIVTWTVTDIHGNITDTAKQKVTVIDNEMPTITVSNINTTNDAGACGATINLPAPVTADNCGIVSVTNNHPSSFFPVGTTTVIWKVTDVAGWVKTAAQTVIVTDTEKPVVLTQNISVALNASGTATVTAAQINNGSTDNCGIASVTLTKTSFTCADLGANTVTLSVTDIHGNTHTQSAIVTVTDNIQPAVTAPAAQIFCSSGGTYTIPNPVAADNCSIASISFAITGATSRSGAGANASGVFNSGVSTITWTVKDASGNFKTASTTVSVTVLPAPIITVSTPDAFCNKLVLTASSGNANAGYTWKQGNTIVAVTQQLNLGLTNADGTYTVAAVANGCTSAPASYVYQKQSQLSSYTILTYKNAEIGKYNKVASGSVGVMGLKGKAEFKSYSAVNGPGSFVKAPKIERNGSNISINSQITGAASVSLPAMQYNTSNTRYLSNYNANTNNATINGNYNTLTVKRNISITVTGNLFGTIKLEEGASIRFTNPVINIDNFIAEKGAKDDHYSYIRFAAGTSVRVSSKVSLGSQVWVNPDNVRLTFYMGDTKSDEEKFSVYGTDTKVTANIFMPDGKLKVTATDSDNDWDACDHRPHNYWSCRHRYHQHNDCDHRGHRDDDCNDDVYMTGVFIVEELESKGNTVIWNSYDCNSLPTPVVNSKNATMQKLTGETVSTEEDLKITVMPNPSTTYFTLKFASRFQANIDLRVIDANGRVVDNRSNIGANSTIQIGHSYSSGTYYAEAIQNGRKKIVQLLKVK